jgi:hypothetical protein
MNQDRLRDSRYSYYLVEDGDPSYGLQKPGKAHQMKADNWVINLQHPSQSPDLNLSEGIWLILKERVRKHTWNSLRELKAIIQQVWAEIDQDEIRRRIDEMPWHCKQLIETGGLPIRSERW